MEGVGIALVFLAISIQIFLKWQKRQQENAKPSTPPLPAVDEESGSDKEAATPKESFDESTPKEVQRLLRKNVEQQAA
eukprot:scaffold104_cov33-Tisochrysis_lutea.AAC.2